MAVLTRSRGLQLSRRSYGSGPLITPARIGAAIRAGSAAYRGAQAVKSIFSRGTQSGGRAISSSTPVTTQFDMSSRYRYKRMNRRKRRRWVSAVKRNAFMDQKAQPLQTSTFDFCQRSTYAVDSQASFGFCLYPVDMGLAGEQEDLKDMFIQAFSAANSPWLNRKIYMKSACIDVQLCNTGTVNAILDVYTIVCKLNWPTASQGLGTIWSTTFGEQTAITAASSTNPANTPFQNPNFCRHFKILSKKEILLGAGQTTTLQMRDPKSHLLSGRKLTDQPNCIPYLTRGFFFQVRGIPQYNAGSSPQQFLAAGEITCGIQKTYNWAFTPGPSTIDQITNN